MDSPSPLSQFIAQKFGRLTVIETYKAADSNGATALCRCDCGTERVYNLRSVRRGRSRSCGCASVERMRTGIRRSHGEGDWRNGKRTVEYVAWLEMRWRCNPRNKAAKAWYSDRGIQVCERWSDYEAFLADMGRRPEGMELDRINNDGNYEPGNVRWTTKTVNVNNRRTTLRVKLGEHEVLLSELAKDLGVGYHRLYRSLNRTRPAGPTGVKA